jgi:hypothetical protein
MQNRVVPHVWTVTLLGEDDMRMEPACRVDDLNADTALDRSELLCSTSVHTRVALKFSTTCRQHCIGGEFCRGRRTMTIVSLCSDPTFSCLKLRTRCDSSLRFDVCEYLFD